MALLETRSGEEDELELGPAERGNVGDPETAESVVDRDTVLGISGSGVSDCLEKQLPLQAQEGEAMEAQQQ